MVTNDLKLVNDRLVEGTITGVVLSKDFYFGSKFFVVAVYVFVASGD